MKRAFEILSAVLLLSAFADASLFGAEPKPAWQADWEKTVKAAEEEGAVTIYMTGAFELVCREVFQKKFPKIKVNAVTGRGFQLSQRVTSERRADKYIADLYISGTLRRTRYFIAARCWSPSSPCWCCPK